MQIKVYNQKGEVQTTEEIPEFSKITETDKKLVSQVIVAYLSSKRKPIAHTKTRGEVRGGGRKPWKQKGTGRARAGSIRSPLWRGGGAIFGPQKTRKFEKKINKKIKRKALSIVLKDKAMTNRLIILENFPSLSQKEEGGGMVSSGRTQDVHYGAGKTKEMSTFLKKIIQSKEKPPRILIALSKKENFVLTAIKNLPYVETVPLDSLNVYQLIKNDYLLTDRKGFKKIRSYL